MADGLGHGPDAARAARAAVARSETAAPTYRQGSDRGDPSCAAAHARSGGGSRPSRLRPASSAFAGVGNISANVLCQETRPSVIWFQPTAPPATDARHIREFSYPWPEGSLVILHSDGIATHWVLDDYPGLAARDPALIAGVIYRDFTSAGTRRRDNRSGFK